MFQLRKLQTSNILHIGLFAVIALLFLIVRKMPLIGTLGLESGNLFTVIMGPFLALAACFPKNAQEKSYKITLVRELSWLCAHMAFLIVLLFLNGLNISSCSQGAGLMPFLVISLPPLILAISIFSFIGVSNWHWLLKISIHFLSYLAYYLWLGFCWWQEANFRIFSHGSIVLTTDLLQGNALSPAVVGFRASTLLLSLAIMIIGTIIFAGRKQTMFGRGASSFTKKIFLILFLLAANVIVAAKSIEYAGPSRRQLKKDYKLLAQQGSLKVFADPQKTKISDAQEILMEGLYYQEQLEKQLGQISNRDVVVWLHHTNEDKLRYTGAKNVHFALPVHREIHISGYGQPHSVLGHELAHIYIGEHSRTLFGVPGFFFIIPNMALTEGMAVMLTPELNVVNGLSLMQQAQAIHQVVGDINIDKLFSLNPFNFEKLPLRVAYIMSGTACQFLFEQIPKEERPAKLKELAAKGRLPSIFADHKTYHLNINKFKSKLNEPLPPYAAAWAKQNFLQKSILVSNCQQTDEEKTANENLLVGLLNQDVEKIIHSVKHQDPNEKLHLYTNILANLQKNAAYEQALDFMSSLDVSVFDPTTNAQMALKKINSFINLARYQDAMLQLSKIDPVVLGPHELRLFFILQTLLPECIKPGPTLRLSKAAALLIFSSNDNFAVRLMDLAYHMGRVVPKTITSQRQKETVLYGNYLLARANIRSKRFNNALKQIEPVIANQELIKKPILFEALKMLATINLHLGHLQSSLNTFNHLLSQDLSLGDKVLFEDQKNRIYF